MIKSNLLMLPMFIVLSTSCTSQNRTKRVTTLKNKRGEIFTFHGNGMASVKGPFNEDLGVHKTNINEPNENSEVQLIKEEDKSAVYVGHIGLNGGCQKCNIYSCKNSTTCIFNFLKFPTSIQHYNNNNNNNDNNDKEKVHVVLSDSIEGTVSKVYTKSTFTVFSNGEVHVKLYLNDNSWWSDSTSNFCFKIFDRNDRLLGSLSKTEHVKCGTSFNRSYNFKIPKGVATNASYISRRHHVHW